MPDHVTSHSGPSASRPPLRLLLANPRGFCAGVRRAIAAVEDALARYGPPVYVRRPIVHNMAVVRALEAKGAVFVEELDSVPEGGVVILSAHGVARAVRSDAERRRLRWFDAVCPLVEKVHREVVRHGRAGRQVVLVGHAGHPEIVGTAGQLPPGQVAIVSSAQDVESLPIDPGGPTAYAVQTTYAADEAREIVAALTARFPDLAAPPTSDICYATSNRQEAVRAMAPGVDALIVAGELFSSNARRLAEVALAAGCRNVQVAPEAESVDWARIGAPARLGLTAAASTPEAAVDGIVAALGARFDLSVEEVDGRQELTSFRPLKVA